MIEKLIKEKGSGYHNSNTIVLFSWSLFFYFFLMEDAGCLPNFVPVNAEPGTNVVAIDVVHAAIA